MPWSDIGFNDNLSVAEFAGGDQLDPQAFDQFTPQIPGSKISGLIQSQDGRIKLDLDNNAFIVSDGVIDRVRLGKLSDGTYGLLIQDVNGNKLMQISEGTNIIQSSSGSFVIDIGNEQFIVYEGGIPRIILGKFVGLF